MGIDAFSNDLTALMREAAQHKSVVRYSEIYDLAGRHGVNQSQIWSSFEAVCSEICDREIAIYDALLENSQGLPASGFFDVYMNRRQNEYRKQYGSTGSASLSLENKRAIVKAERMRVYAHANS